MYRSYLKIHFLQNLWDVNNEAPCVGIRTKETNDIPAFDSEGKEYLIEAQYIPAYPIVVIKMREFLLMMSVLEVVPFQHLLYLLII